MKKASRLLAVLFISGLLLAACGDGEAADGDIPVPEELIASEDPEDTLEIKDQLGLSMGESGWVKGWMNNDLMEVTLHEVEARDEVAGEEPGGHDSDGYFWVVANITFENHGDSTITGQGFEYPLLLDGKTQDKIENGTFSRSEDVLGYGDTAIPVEDKMNEQPRTEPGEERTGNVVFIAKHEADSYIIYFGMDDYDNTVTWEFDATEMK